MKRLVTVVAVVLVLALGGVAWWFRAPLWGRVRALPLPVGRAHPQPQAETYSNLVAECANWRERMAGEYRRAKTAEEKAAVVAGARGFLETVLPAMMRCWLGTPWDFNGTAEQPGTKGIACGYFVATILRDAGFRVDRVPLAQQASQTILRTFVTKDQMLLRVGLPYDAFATEIKQLEPGVHIVGLDSHVGFVVVRDGGFRFLHSSGQRPWCVVDEGEADASALRASNYRVLGNLTADPELVRRWLLGRELAVGKR